ncbi:hypothetical protein E2C01_050935 [Portunus trituberculatus]|uniref:Uncharacterized protein n=1 Tax=Portunus trituberculatus TaxID=210409 RepID=A0A5B7GIV4_PORTR|nr:hypothetical protein [Portunus trituberculatus]
MLAPPPPPPSSRAPVLTASPEAAAVCEDSRDIPGCKRGLSKVQRGTPYATSHSFPGVCRVGADSRSLKLHEYRRAVATPPPPTRFLTFPGSSSRCI